MRLEPPYSVRFRYPDDWAVELGGEGGPEEQHFDFADVELVLDLIELVWEPVSE